MATLPSANISILLKAGYCRSLKISLAAASSGLMILEIPSFFRRKRVSFRYRGFRTLAMVFTLSEVLFTIRQARRFSSSEGLTAMKMSALSRPASLSVLISAPLPCTGRMSMASAAAARAFSLLSITETSWPSFTRVLASSVPTFPQPTITAFISSSKFDRYTIADYITKHP